MMVFEALGFQGWLLSKSKLRSQGDEGALGVWGISVPPIEQCPTGQLRGSSK